MLISGFSIVRNGIKFDYPFLESIQSALSVCDEFIINVGESEDATLQKILELKSELTEAEAKKLKIFQTRWPIDEVEKRKGGRILAEQTNLALSQCQGKWCLYLQADEVLHEQDLSLIRNQLQQWELKPEIEAVVFQYHHFYGSYDVVQVSRSAYRREIRVVRNGLGIESIGDAQSFRHKDGRKLSAVLTQAAIYHYGWVRAQDIMREKTEFMDALYHPTANSGELPTGDNYRYKRIVGLKPFQGTHPWWMKKRVENAPRFDFSSVPKVFHLKDVWKLISGGIEQVTGIRLFEYKNYKLRGE